MLGKMALIQGLAREQEELRTIISQLHQDIYNNMKQTVKVGDQVIDQPPRRQGFGLVKNGPLQVTTTSRVQQQPHQKQQVDQSKPNTPKRQFTTLNMPLSQALQHLLRLNLVTLRDPPKNPNTASPRYNPDERCAYHSGSPGHDTDDCWSLKNKIQDLIDGRVLEFMPDGEMKIFR